MEIRGYVDHIIYHNVENAYTVMSVAVDGEEEVVVGTFPGISEGENLTLRGDYVTHASYGEQFKATSYEVRPPEDAVAMERYLGSGAIKGVGPKLAARIVKTFQGDTFRVMEEDPVRLSKIRGISEKMALDICEQIVEKRDAREAMVFLERYGIHSNLAMKVYRQYGPQVYSIIANNPYRMAEDISGVGFKIADEIASKVGISTNSEYRIHCGVLYTLNQAASSGHTYLPESLLLRNTAHMLGLTPEDIQSNLMNLAMEKKIVIRGQEDPQVYAGGLYRMEEMTAGMMLALNHNYHVRDERIDAAIARVEKGERMELDPQQRAAVTTAIRHGVCLMTGGPGTGKTTTIRAMLNYFLDQGFNVQLAAPTGRAAKRMSEATGCPAKTIHRLLEVSGGVGEEGDSLGRFERNQFHPLEAEVVIVDEMSMVDIFLMHALLRAVADQTRLILVGDMNQLPSVGPGNVLRDLIESRAFPTVRLDRIFRQSEASDIVVNAHRINRGQFVALDNKSRDFFFLKREDADHIISVILQLVRDKLPSYVGADMFDIQVLTPTRKGLLGVERLNEILQKYLNPEGDSRGEYRCKERIFREGDKVMQIKNNYQMEWEVRSRYGLALDKGTGVFNGDMGRIEEVDHFSQNLIVRYDEDRLVTYPFKQLDELELAYAITIHKSQGTEYPAVVIPLLDGPRMLLNRNLIYTAVTRARSCVTLVGKEQVFRQMCENNTQARRFSGLCQRIKEQVQAQEELRKTENRKQVQEDSEREKRGAFSKT